MQIHISPNDGAPIYLQIMNQIKYLVASGRLESGEQLPPVRKLAEELTINPNTVARVYRELESQGILATRRGAGVFISEGGSPLARNERIRILSDRIDLLLAEARQMGVSTESLVELLHQRERRLKPSGKE